MWTGVLGPLFVLNEGRPVTVSAGKQRVILAALLTRANHVVSFDELGEMVWDGRPPAHMRTAVRNYVMRLRQTLGPAVGGRILTRPPGYLIEAADDEVDLLRFTDLYRSGGTAVRSGNWRQAAQDLGAAVALWRAEPLVDIPSAVLRSEELPRLHQMRLQAVEWRIEADLQLDCSSELVPELQEVVGQYPLRERFHAQLMLALYRSGRQAEALAAYQAARRVLVDELGVDPGIDLQRMHQRILAGDPALGAGERAAGASGAPARGDSTPVPQQLPGTVRHFAGRAAELNLLAGLLDDPTWGDSAVVISTIAGTAGVGKTALAVHWAHQVARHFPDGQLFVNLRGFDPSGPPVSSAEAIRGFLDALGVPDSGMPTGAEAQAGLYRSLLAGKRMFVVLDNARDVAQVRPLLPGSSSCLTVITSRNQLTGLVAAEGAHLITVDLLEVDDARELLARQLGPERVRAEAAAVDQLIELCGRLPLALSVAAARVATRTDFPLSGLVAELREDPRRLDAFDSGDTATDVRAVFSGSYRHLGAAAARAFRLLGLHVGPDIALPAAASLVGLPLHEARRALGELTRSHLLTEHAPGRFVFHDLMRAYAAECAAAECEESERRAAINRLLDYYLHTAHTTSRLLNPDQDPISLEPPRPGVLVEHFADDAQAVAWLKAEHGGLLAAVTQAVGHGFDAHAWQIPMTLVSFFSRRGHWHDAVATQTAALQTATGRGDRAVQARAHGNLGRAFTLLGSGEEADTHLRRALALYRELEDHLGQASAQLGLALLCDQEGSSGEALDRARQALELYRQRHHRSGQAEALNAAGWYHAQLAEYRHALDCCHEALELHRQVGNRAGEADTWHSLAHVYQQLGDYEQALGCYHRALSWDRQLGHSFKQAETLSRIGDIQAASGDLEAAGSTWRSALAIFDGLNNPEATQLRARLRDLDSELARLPDTASLRV